MGKVKSYLKTQIKKLIYRKLSSLDGYFGIIASEKVLGLKLVHSNIDFSLHLKFLAKKLKINLPMMRTIRIFFRKTKVWSKFATLFSFPISFTALTFEVILAKQI